MVPRRPMQQAELKSNASRQIDATQTPALAGKERCRRFTAGLSAALRRARSSRAAGSMRNIQASMPGHPEIAALRGQPGLTPANQIAWVRIRKGDSHKRAPRASTANQNACRNRPAANAACTGAAAVGPGPAPGTREQRWVGTGDCPHPLTWATQRRSRAAIENLHQPAAVVHRKHAASARHQRGL